MACECNTDDVPPTVWRQATVRRSRKPATCCECRSVIPVGSSFLRTFGVWDCEPKTFITCADCLAFLAWVEAHLPCFCYAYGQLFSEAADDCYEWAQEEALPELYDECRARIKRLNMARAKTTQEAV